MPIYAYRCAACGHAKDVLQKLSDPLLTVCPACGAESFSKQLTAAGFQLKGSGWYATDFKGSGAAPAAKPDGAADKATDKPAEKGTEKGADKAADKPADKPADKSGGGDSSGPAPAAAASTSTACH